MNAHIQKMHHRFYLPPSALRQRQRLGELLEGALDHAVSQALYGMGLSVNDQVLVRQVRVPVSVRLSAPDAELVTQWCDTLAAQLRAALCHQDDTEIVRYQNHYQLLQDFILGIASGQLRRSWAWRMAGMLEIIPETAQLRGDVGLTPAAVKSALLQQLMAAPEFIVPVFAELEKRSLAAALTHSWNALDWDDIVYAAAKRLGATPQGIASVLLLLDKIAFEETSGDRLAAPRGAAEHLGEQRTPLVNDVRPGQKSGLRLLKVLAQVPTFFQREILHANEFWLTQFLRKIVIAHKNIAASSSESLNKIPDLRAMTEQRANSRDDIPTKNKNHSSLWPVSVKTEIPSSFAENFNSSAPQNTAHDDTTLSDGKPSGDASPEAFSRREPFTAEKAHSEESEFAQVFSIDTDYAGLVFLLNIMVELDIVDGWMRDCTLGEYAVSSLIIALLAEAFAKEKLYFPRQDASVRVCCGLPLNSQETAVPQTEFPKDISNRIEKDAARLLHRCFARLQCSTETGQTDTTPSLLQFVCQRPARLYADRGWITVALPLAQIDTRIRRAALDFDPGYILWLGYVVKINYE